MDKSALTEQRREMVINLLKGMKIRKSDGEGFDKDDVYACMQQLCDVYEKSIDDLTVSYETEIGEFETAGELFDRLMHMGAELLVRTLRAIENGTAPRTPQDHTQATYVKMLDKSISPIDWNKRPREIVKHIYGLQPWPVATMELEGKTFRVFGAAYTDHHTGKAPGSVVSAGDAGIEISCADGETLLVTELQAPGKKRMRAGDFLRGHRIEIA